MKKVEQELLGALRPILPFLTEDDLVKFARAIAM
jgi:hypothetical protein